MSIKSSNKKHVTLNISALFWLLITAVNCERLFLIGDSVDRYIVQEYCLYYRSLRMETKEFNWGDTNIRYASIRGMMPSLICEVPAIHDSVAFVHIFGSSPVGPYFHNFMNSAADSFVDTTVRVAKALSLYYEHIGPPDRVIFHTEKWDIQYIHDAFDSAPTNSDRYNQSVVAFINNTHARLDEIRKIIGNDVDLGLRTGVWGRKGNDLLRGFNEIVRKIAAERNMTFYDFDKDVWSTVDFDYDLEPFLFRDYLHPRIYYTAPAAEKMLGRRYSRQMYFARNESMYSNRFKNYFATFDPTVTIKLIRGIGRPADEWFYFNKETKLRYVIPSPAFLKMMRLGQNDVFDVPPDVMEVIPIGPPIPKMMFEAGAVLNSTQRDHLYYVSPDLVRREMPNEASAHALALSPEHIVHLDASNDFWMDYIHNPLGSDLPDIFSDCTLLKLRGSREIFYIQGGRRRSIPNMDVFSRLGKDLSEVKTLSAQRDVDAFNLIPVGDPLS